MYVIYIYNLTLNRKIMSLSTQCFSSNVTIQAPLGVLGIMASGCPLEKVIGGQWMNFEMSCRPVVSSVCVYVCASANMCAFVCVCTHICSLLLGNPNFKDPYLIAQTVQVVIK